MRGSLPQLCLHLFVLLKRGTHARLAPAATPADAVQVPWTHMPCTPAHIPHSRLHVHSGIAGSGGACSSAQPLGGAAMTEQEQQQRKRRAKKPRVSAQEQLQVRCGCSARGGGVVYRGNVVRSAGRGACVCAADCN